MSGHRIHPAVVHVGVILVGAATLALSAYFQWQLGMLAGSVAVAATLPVALDVGGAVAGVCWISGTGALRRWGAGISIAQVLASTAVNILAHGLLHGWQWAPLGAVYPVVFFAMVKLELLHQEQTRDLADAHTELVDGRAVRAANAAERDGEQVEARVHAEEMERLADRSEKARRAADEAREHTTGRTAPAPRSSSPKRAPARTTDLTTVVAWAAGELAAGESAGWRRIAREHGLSEHGAKKAAQQAREQHEQTPRIHAVKEA